MKKGHTIFKWAVLTLLMAYAAGMTVWAHYEASRHVCTGIRIDVEGNTPMTPVIDKGVREELRRYPAKIKGAPLNQINTQAIEQYLGKLDNFESVHCMLSSGGELRIRIIPLVPVMRVFFGDNSYYVNKDGKRIPSSADFFTETPIVTGDFNRGFPPKEVLPLVRYVDQDPFLKELTSMIVARDSRNLIIVPRVFGHVVNMGDTTRLAEKSRALSLFYRKVMPHKGWEEYDTISVKFKGQIVATRRDKTILNHGEDYVEEVDLEEGTLPEAPVREEATAAEKKQEGEPETGE